MLCINFYLVQDNIFSWYQIILYYNDTILYQTRQASFLDLQFLNQHEDLSEIGKLRIGRVLNFVEGLKTLPQNFGVQNT